MSAVAYYLSIDQDPARRKQGACLLTAVMRQVGEEAIQAHQLVSGISPRAQRGQRQALSLAGAGISFWICGVISIAKHQQDCSILAGSH